MRAFLLALGLPLVASSACETGDRTAVMVHVCLSLEVPGDVAFARVVVEHAYRPAVSHVVRLEPGARWATLSVRPGTDLAAEEDFYLSVVGLDDAGRQVVARTVHTWFSPSQDRDVAVYLEPDCLGVVCREGETCGAGICSPVNLTDDRWCPTEP